MRIEDEIQSKFSNDYQKLAINIHLTSARIGEEFQAELKARKLTFTQYNVLRILKGQNQKPVCIGLLKERMIERHSDVSRIIDRLDKKEFILREANKSDRRLKDIVISNKGLELLEDLESFRKLFWKEFDHLSPKEIKTLNDLLDKVRTKPK